MSPSADAPTPALQVAPREDVALAADGSRVAAVRVRGDKTASALVLHFHGGVFVGGSLDSGAGVAGILAAAGATVVSIDYPLAPSHPFPQAVEAGYAALEWMVRSRRRLAASRAPMYVAGEEAGGNLAAAVAMMARDRDGPKLAGQILLSPMLDACVATASQRKVNAGPQGCPCADGWRAYLQRANDATHPYAVPASAVRLAGLPATLLITAEDDPLRDETRAFAKRLRSAGIPVDATVLALPTGWPRSYAHSEGAAWAEVLREQIRPFYAATGPCRSSNAAPHGTDRSIS